MGTKELNLNKCCVICHEEIDFNKEKYVRLTDFDGKKQDGECFYHLKCWKDRFEIQRRKAMETVKGPLMELSKMMNNLKKEDTYYVG